jgi:PAS domain S-box-containing protein
MTHRNLLKILFIEDIPSDVELAVMELRKEGIQFEHIRIDTRDEFIKTLNDFKPDIVISDYTMPSYNGMQALKDSREFDPSIPFILCTGSQNEETAVKCLKAGADDYVIKEHLTRLPFAVKEALEKAGIQKEKRASELLLKENEEKLQSIFSAAPVGIGLAVDDIIIEVNDTFCKMIGYDRKELIGKSSEIMYPTREEYEFVDLEKNRQIAEKGVGSVETRLKCKNGRILNIISGFAPLDAGDLSKGLTFTVLDITESKQAEIELRRAKEKVESSDKLKTTFLNNISHEVRTPLNGILGFAEIISQIDLSEEDKKLSLSMLFESSDRLLNTITNYMDISLITSGNMTENRKEFVPEQIMKELLGKYKTICSVKKLELLLKMPEHSDKFSINSDPEILNKIISHLLSNAIKFTEIGSIQYGYTVRKNELEFFVTDTGTGIGKESLNDIFERFIKEDNGPLKLSEGSGLGLSIARGLVQILGGKIWVESEKGKGSTFFFRIPVGKEFENHHLSIATGQQKKDKLKNTILVAEDDEINFFYLNALLIHETGVTVLHASNGREAVEMFRDNPDIVLILMDIMMPVMDGIDATRQIRAINRDVPIIAITAFKMEGDEARILDAGCDYFMTKPIDKKLLLARMSECIN